MAKESMKAREVKRAKLVARYAEKRAALKKIIATAEDPADAYEAARKLQAIPKNANPIRLHNRCKITGRPKGYNTQQSGATKEMCESMKKDITEKKPDFVVLRLVEEFPERSAYLKQLGYHECYFFTNVIWNEKCCLLTRHNVKMPPPSFKVTPTDVLFKRKIF